MIAMKAFKSGTHTYLPNYCQDKNDENNDFYDDNTWYKNIIPPQQANIAFTFYGTLKSKSGSMFSSSSSSIFDQKHYINSYYTPGVIEIFL